MKDNGAIESAKGVLQDLVVVVSLVRTLTESFGSASDLYRKLKKKSKSIIEDGENEQERERHRPLRRRDSDSDNERGHHRRIRFNTERSWSRKGKEDSSDSDDESIHTSSSLIRAEYDRGYRYLGEEYARGDLITQNQLQSQIIGLQQTLLNIYEDITLSSYLSPTSSYSHLTRLLQTTRAARAASIEALAMQYRRMQSQEPPEVPDTLPLPPGAFPIPSNKSHELVVRRRKSQSRTRERNRSRSPESSNAGRRLKLEPVSKPTPNNLFCVYALDLQHNHALPLADNFKADGDNRCPFCHSLVPTQANKAWEIVKDDEKMRDVDRTFFIGNRFLVKCHREGGGFACVLCRGFRKADTVCGEVRALVEHLWREHSCAELKTDGDIGEMR